MLPDAEALAPIPEADSRRWSGVAMAEARAICERLGLGLAAVVGATEVPPGGLSSPALHRIGCLVGIDRALGVVLGDHGRAWMHQPNTGAAFAGRAPAALVQCGALGGLLAVRSVLDGWRGGVLPFTEAGEALRLRVYG